MRPVCRTGRMSCQSIETAVSRSDERDILLVRARRFGPPDRRPVERLGLVVLDSGLAYRAWLPPRLSGPAGYGIGRLSRSNVTFRHPITGEAP